MRIILSLSLVMGLFFLNGCKKEGGGLLPEELTSLEITFTPIADETPLKLGTVIDPTVFKFKVIEGNDPELEITGPNLYKDVNYAYFIRVLDETNAPDIVINLTDEIVDEGESHLICFDEIGSSNIVFSNQSNDISGKKLGIFGNVVVNEAGAYKLKVTLKHNPNKNAANPCNTGETDIEATFDFDVEILM